MIVFALLISSIFSSYPECYVIRKGEISYNKRTGGAVVSGHRLRMKCTKSTPAKFAYSGGVLCETGYLTGQNGKKVFLCEVIDIERRNR